MSGPIEACFRTERFKSFSEAGSQAAVNLVFGDRFFGPMLAWSLVVDAKWREPEHARDAVWAAGWLVAVPLACQTIGKAGPLCESWRCRLSECRKLRRSGPSYYLNLSGSGRITPNTLVRLTSASDERFEPLPELANAQILGKHGSDI